MCSRRISEKLCLQSVESALLTVLSLYNNRCVTVSLGLAKDWFANNSSRYFRAIHQTISLR